MSYPVVRILESRDRRLRSGGPWLYSNELQIDRAAKDLPPGSVVRLVAQDGKAMALAAFNPHSLIAARVLTRNTEVKIDGAFFARRIRRALALRERLFHRPFYRLIHAEADGIPGLVVDRFGDLLVGQRNSAAADAMREPLDQALREATGAARILHRDEPAAREREGLTTATVVPAAEPATLIVEENGLPFRADPAHGQKTGWYFDQRLNRAFAAQFARGEAALDLFSYAGGFGLTALAHGAATVLLVDRSAHALELAREAARLQGRDGSVDFLQADVFDAIEELSRDKRRFGLVIADPPPFVPSRKDLPVGLKAYQKLARGSAGLVGDAGVLCISCCSHNVDDDAFLRCTYAGIRSAGRSGTLVHRAGAGPDHPVHPALPETAYLKFLVYALD